MNSAYRIARRWLVLFSIALLAACATGNGSASAAKAALPAPSPPDFAKLDAEIDAVLSDDWPERDPYAYEPTGKRDPFRPPSEVTVVLPPIDTDHGQKPECLGGLLAGTHLDEVRLEGIVRMESGRDARATLAGVDGRGSIVRVGDKVADECGVVTSIGEDRVSVAEPQRTQRGEWITHPYVLWLHGAPDSAVERLQ